MFHRSFRRNNKKKKCEFSKKLAVLLFVIGIMNLVVYHSEVLLALRWGSSVLPDASIGTQTIITIFGGFTSYCLYQLGLKNSRNKYGVDADGQPYKQNSEEQKISEVLNSDESKYTHSEGEG